MTDIESENSVIILPIRSSDMVNIIDVVVLKKSVPSYRSNIYKFCTDNCKIISISIILIFSWIFGNIVRINEQNTRCSNVQSTLCKCSFDCKEPFDLFITICCGLIICFIVYIFILTVSIFCISICSLGSINT